MNRTAGAIIIAIAALTLTACNKGGDKAGSTTATKAQPVTKFPESTKIDELMPAAAGAASTFVSANGTGEITLKIKSSTTQGQNRIVVMEVIENNKVSDTVTWQIGPTGIFQLTARNGKAYTPPQMAVFPKFDDNTEKKYNGTGPYPSVETGKENFGPMEGITRNRGIETIDTDMGQIEALATESLYAYKSGGKAYQVKNTTWFAPKYGIVRYLQTLKREDGQSQTVTLKLKGFRTK
jgi:hypothetical protein